MKKYLLITFLLLAATACDKGSSGDPETNDLGEFNPPGQLESITQDDSVYLTWVGANAEDDFQGYHVFATTTTKSDLKDLATFPSGADTSAGSSVPRCKDNSAFFEAFGFPSTDADCESSVIEDAAEEAEEAATINGSYLKAATLLEDEDADDETLTIDFNAPCTEVSGSDAFTAEDDLSLKTGGALLGRAFCKIAKAWDPDSGKLVDMANGTPYTFIVMAVKGEDKNQVSWISEVIEDTPALTAYNDELTLSGGATNAEFTYWEIEATEDVSTLTAADAAKCTTVTNVCDLTSSGLNAESTKGIYLGRDRQGSSGTYAQRFFISTSSSSAIQLQARGPELPTDGPDSLGGFNRGDSANSTSTYPDAGTKFAFFGATVFDIKLTTGDGDRYGKIAIHDVSFADDFDSDSTLKIVIVLQPLIGSTAYLRQ